MSDIEIITFGCRLNAYEIRSHAPACERRRAQPRGDRQHLRGDGGSRAPGARRRSEGAARATPTPRSWSRAARRRSIRERFAGMAEVDHVIGNQEKTECRTLRRSRVRRHRAGRGQRHHVGAARPRAISSTASAAARAPMCRSRTAAIIAARSASSRSAAGRRARCRRARWWRRCGGWSSNGYAEIVLTGVDITAYGARPSRRDRRSASWCARCSKLVPELPRLRLSSIDSIEADADSDGGDRRGGAADAASPSLAAGRRRPHAEAHEAPPLARRLDRVLRGGAPRCARTWCSAPT